jgi:altronate dehydratase large subunit
MQKAAIFNSNNNVATAAITEGTRHAEAMAAEVAKAKREPCDDTELLMGIKCGASDTTSGLAANPATGQACDM